jgi:hypothetical protein
VEDEAKAMAVTRIINLKETVIIAESRDMPKQHAGCFPAMRAKGLHGSSQEKMARKPEQQQRTLEAELNTF